LFQQKRKEEVKALVMGRNNETLIPGPCSSKGRSIGEALLRRGEAHTVPQIKVGERRKGKNCGWKNGQNASAAKGKPGKKKKSGEGEDLTRTAGKKQ